MLISVPILLIVITIHEFAHAKAADMLGDPTPRYFGRLTLNPFSHLDPIGFLMLFIFRFGWAKPVPVNPANFRDPKSGEVIVSLAGPVSNLFLAWALLMIIKFSPIGMFSFDKTMIIAQILSYAAWINIALAVFNLIPIPPLDGSRVLEALLPPGAAGSMRVTMGTG
jgi:Zn-dependent protease